MFGQTVMSLISTIGKVLMLKLKVSDATQPLISLTPTIYCPAVFTSIVGEVAAVLHKYSA